MIAMVATTIGQVLNKIPSRELSLFGVKDSIDEELKTYSNKIEY